MISTYRYQRYMKINIIIIMTRIATVAMAATIPIIMAIGEESDSSSGATVYNKITCNKNLHIHCYF